MFYKKEVRSVVINEVEETIINWHVGRKVLLSVAFNKVILTEDNKQELNGWEWYDTPPQEYLDWLETQEIDERS